MEARVAEPAAAYGEGHVLIRFLDNEVVEGDAVQLDFVRPDFELRLQEASNNRVVLVSMPAVKCVTLERRSLEGWSADWPLQKVAVHFRDGEVLKGLLGRPPAREPQGMVLTLVSPARDQVERLGVPWVALKGLFFLRTWDSRAPGFSREQQPWSWQRSGTPLVDLLGEIQVLNSLHARGDIDEVEFQRRRRDVLREI